MRTTAITVVRRAPVSALLLVPGALTVFLAFRSGGYFPGPTSLVAAEVALLLALWIAAARRSLSSWTPGLVAAATLLLAFGAWTLASQGWSSSPDRADAEWTRVVLYAGVLLLAGFTAGSARRTRLLVWGIAAAIVGISIAALVARTLPNVISDVQPIHPERLAYPLSYWNSLGILAGLGAILCGHLTCDVREPRLVRVLAAGAVPLLAATVYYTFSRGATWASLCGVVLYVIVARPRAAICAAVATVPATLAALAIVNPANALTEAPLSPEALEAGRRFARSLGFCALAAAAVRALLLPVDARLARVEVRPLARRSLLAGAAVLLVGAGTASAVALDLPAEARERYDEFNSAGARPGQTGSSRLFSTANNGRIEQWDVALAEHRIEPRRGRGAGTYESAWARERDSDLTVRDAHSLYVEVLGELGIVGLALVGGALLLILAAFAWRARGPNRPLYAALLAAGVAWALHAGVDWDWEMPAVTLWLFAAGGAALGRRRPPREASRTASLAGGAMRVAAVAACLAAAILPARLALAEGRLAQGVEAMQAGDCRTALADARSSLDALERAAPYQLIAWCERDRRPGAALAAMEAAVRREPADWQQRYDRAVLLAANGLDPRGEARAAALLNPNHELTGSVLARLAAAPERLWRREGRRAPLVLP